MDKIILSSLSVRAIVGVLPEERTRTQPILLDIILYTDIEKACASDDILDATDYKLLSEEASSVVERGKFRLIESAAAAVAECCLAHEKVLEVTVRIRKPRALRNAACAGCEIHRVKT